MKTFTAIIQKDEGMYATKCVEVGKLFNVILSRKLLNYI